MVVTSIRNGVPPDKQPPSEPAREGEGSAPDRGERRAAHHRRGHHARHQERETPRDGEREKE